MFLEARPTIHIDRVFVKPFVDRDQLEAEVTLRNDTARPATVSLAGDVLSWTSQAGKDMLSAPLPRGKLSGPSALKINAVTATVPANGSTTVTLTERVTSRLKLWSPESPNLYGLVCRLKNESAAVSDVKQTRFGWRQVTFQGTKVLLNNRPLIIKGDSWHFMGIPQMTRRYAWAWYKTLRDANLNAVRLHAQPYPEFYLDMADEMGILVLDETAVWASDGGPKVDSSAFWRDTETHLQNLILRDRNHPSVFGWSISNEMMAVVRGVFHAPQEQQDEVIRHYSVWADICRKADPTRAWISADGEDDGSGALPTYVVHYGGTGALERAAKSGKPWGVGEAGPAYYGTPEQIAEMSGNGRSYLSFRDRMEGVAAVSYQSLMDQRRLGASFRSVFNLVWYGLKPLELGMKDTTHPPALSDGITFPPFVEGKPGVQPERLGPYCTTLNPGYDPRLPLYSTWPLFTAIRDAHAEPNAIPYKPAPDSTLIAAAAKSPRSGTIKTVPVLSGPGGTLARSLIDLGVTVVPENPRSSEGEKPELLFVDGAQPP
ncbi:MAG: glycoside hydrolase family 2 TIM barrel-domain containing protein, partial [Armatimonadota bacterium]